MKIPKKLRICNQDYTVAFKKNLKDGDGSELDGHSLFKKKQILINSDLNGDELNRIFFHEIAHVFFHHYIPEEDSEFSANALAHLILDILKQTEVKDATSS